MSSAPRRTRTRKAEVAAAAVGAVVLAPLVGLAPASAAPDGSGVIINEFYGRGGSANAPYTHKFVELYNPTDQAISLSGMSVQYRSAAGPRASSSANLAGQIEPGGYFLVQLNSNGATGSPLPTPDQVATNVSPSGTTGVVFLADTTELLSIPAGDVNGGPLEDVVIDLLGFGGANAYEGAAAANQGANATPLSWQRTAFVDTDNNLADFTMAPPTPQNSAPGDPEDPVDTCGDPDNAVALVSDIQGSGATFDPACSGEQTVEAVVTAVTPGLSGFYVQEELADSDGDDTSSEGIFVFSRSIPEGVEVGQLVRVTGTVGEYTTSGSSQTQLTGPSVEVVGDAEAIAPTAVTFPVDAPETLEQYEGMLVELTDTLVISEYFNYDRFGEVVLAKPLEGQDRLHTPTAVVDPGPATVELLEEYDRRVITLDDAVSAQNPGTVPHPGNGEPFSAENTFRGGDTVTGVQGVIDNTHGVYRVQPTAYGEYTAANPRPEEAPEVDGRVRVASFNVLNYFLTLDEGPAVCGPELNMDCRGANSAEELERQREKTVDAIAELDAHVVGLMEMENTPGVEPAADLAAGLNDLLGKGTYDFIDTGVVGTDAIRLGFLYQPREVQPVGDFAVLDSSVDPAFDDTKNRPMLTQTFREIGTGEVFTVSVNHLKSKGSACAGDPDTGDGQGNCNLTRTAAAEAIADFLAEDPTGSGDPDHLVIGDLNSYDHEDPIRVLEAAGYTDLVKKFGGEEAYGYVFDGMVGYLDHAVSNESLTPQVTGAAEWHINADEPDILDYNLDFGRPADYWTGDAYRSSDHDPVLVGLDLSGKPGSRTDHSYERGRPAHAGR
ncbi:ExeM/NucH family extracellular endonuclease [Georgenia sp. EYE_87]|uniref:ExeM/NucH family extracellular endonuclease n=1 Tax=Georgenia sp. EYE_87 TaxID=2853448 RepID=UPI002006B931|nr:ExeM/NucH family extracellular endonuclease [Georgenia sp. EYE_87]MCK6209695.1 ExeM/NucH family extracellular endonuclease [Georgenia sp. EYE_87]